MAGLQKRDLALLALKELGVAQTGIDITADELNDVCVRLDAMMASWDGDGIHVGYPVTDTTPVDPSMQTSLRAQAVRAVVCNLAVEVAPMFSVQPQQATMKNAKAGLLTLQALATGSPRVRTRTGTPMGAGSLINGQAGPGGLWSPFQPEAPEEITVGNDSVLDLE